MKNIYSKTAFTLIELIISISLVTVIVLGIFSIGLVLSNNNIDYGQRYLVRSDTQNTLNHILNNAGLASGTITPGDEAIIIGGTHGIVDTNTFCIHQLGTNPPTRGQNIINSGTDIWLCYSQVGTNISWCAVTYTAGGNPRGATDCASAVAASTALNNPATGQKITFLGTAYSTFGADLPVFTNTTTQLLFSITLRNCLINTAAAGCVDASPGNSTQPETNPEVQVSGNVIPSQVSSS